MDTAGVVAEVLVPSFAPQSSRRGIGLNQDVSAWLPWMEDRTRWPGHRPRADSSSWGKRHLIAEGAIPGRLCCRLDAIAPRF
jgi:hypothetical protein